MTTDNQQNVENAVRVLRAALEKGDIKFPGYIHIVLNALEEKERRLAATKEAGMLQHHQRCESRQSCFRCDCWVGRLEAEVFDEHNARVRAAHGGKP